MARITITTTGKLIQVDFGDYWKKSGSPYAIGEVDYKKMAVQNTYFMHNFQDDTHLKIVMNDSSEWFVSHQEDLQNGILKIDTINGVAPTDLDDLWQKISNFLIE